jgi:ABC-type uncharacterized transport system ATPase subunit
MSIFISRAAQIDNVLRTLARDLGSRDLPMDRHGQGCVSESHVFAPWSPKVYQSVFLTEEKHTWLTSKLVAAITLRKRRPRNASLNRQSGRSKQRLGRRIDSSMHMPSPYFLAKGISNLATMQNPADPASREEADCCAPSSTATQTTPRM